jgi:hypothetical protein
MFDFNRLINSWVSEHLLAKNLWEKEKLWENFSRKKIVLLFD